MNKKELLKFFCFVLFAATTLIFWSGSYSIDSWDYFAQVTGGEYNDWHSPLMAFTWKVLYKITGLFYSIYVFQMAIYWLVFYYLLKEIENRYAFIATVCLGIFFLFIPQYVMKDVHVALPWALAFVLLIAWEEKDPGRRKWLILALIVYGLWIRLNTLVAIMPAIYLFVEQYLFKQAGIRKRLAALLGITVLSVGGYFVFAYVLLRTQPAYPEYKLMLQDVTGISIATGQDYMPPCIANHKDYKKDTVLMMYHPASFDDIYWPADYRLLVPRPTEELAKCLKKGWRSAVLQHPWIYFRNRMAGFMYYLRIKKRFAPQDYWNVAYYVHEPNPVGLKREHDRTADLLTRRWNGLYDSIFYDPWFWLLLNTILFIVFLRRYLKHKQYKDKVLAFLQLSAILFLLSQVPVYQHDRDFRYNYWNVMAFIIGFAWYFRFGIKKESS